ncbi:hypothetical protein [Lentilactobacillus sp. SPB1-3]|uniref:Uncharacterized protein n=1 Tax=Lentilactobacillus terminaliae TaxID=3003483 RepID=A0ACD5DFI2_9LACO|nr:hypothetical protein [Lentilactobacillus sp. SPB1-3]MCZ0976431.1 hypothetical protein [Lentilactobacillus sp. SPB1-3]
MMKKDMLAALTGCIFGVFLFPIYDLLEQFVRKYPHWPAATLAIAMILIIFFAFLFILYVVLGKNKRSNEVNHVWGILLIFFLISGLASYYLSNGF